MQQASSTLTANTVQVIRKGELKLEQVEVGDFRSFAYEILVSDADAPLTIGLWQLIGQGELVYEYPYGELKYVLEGTMVLRDETDDQVHRLQAGDMVVFRPGAHVTFLAESKGLIVYAAHR